MKKTRQKNKPVSLIRLLKFINLLTIIVDVSDIKHPIVHGSLSFSNLLGYPVKGMLTKSFFEFVHSQDVQLTREKISTLNTVQTHTIFKNRVRTINEEFKWISWTATRPPNDKHIYLIGQYATGSEGSEEDPEFSSLRAKGAAEDTIIKNEMKYQLLFDKSPLPKIIYDPDNFQILEVNAQALLNYGYHNEEFLLLNMLNLQPLSFREQHEEELRTIRQGKIFRGVYDHIKKNGEIIQVETFSSLIHYNNKQVVIQTEKLIMDQPIFKQQLPEEKSNEERVVLEATLIGQEMERIEIGKTLHDNINQLLSSAKYCYEMAFNNEVVRSSLFEKGTKILEDAISEIRALSKNLVGTNIKERGLTASINNLVETISSSTNIDIVLVLEGLVEELPFNLQLMFFRMIQEQVNNIVKHAFAKKVIIGLSRENDNVNLSITDEGRGFDTTIARTGIGLNNIISRAKLYNGTVEIISTGNEGSKLLVRVPL